MQIKPIRLHLSLEDTEIAFESLNVAIAKHAEWLTNWNRALLCGIEFDKRPTTKDNQCHCGLGRWLVDNKKLYENNDSDFEKVCELHNEMHKKICQLLAESEHIDQITHKAYDSFVRTEKAFSESIIKLRDEIFEQLFSYDYLTKVMTRQSIYSAIVQEHARVVRKNDNGCIAFVDLDHFKSINDTHGHIIGDQVLVYVADFFNQHLRPYDSIGRFGGEEFLILLPHTSPKVAKEIMERLRLELSQKAKENKSKYHLPTVSIGIAPILSSASVSEILEHADNALYESKNQGRNRVKVWDGSQSESV